MEIDKHFPPHPLQQRPRTNNTYVMRPDNPWGYNNLAVQYQRLEEIDKAIALYQQAAEANPNAERRPR